MPPRIPLKGSKPTQYFARCISNTRPAKIPRQPFPTEPTDSATRLYNIDRPSSHRNNNTTRTLRGSNAARTSTAALQDLIKGTSGNGYHMRQREEKEKLREEQRVSEEYLSQMPRQWKEGDVFSPHDLSGAEMRKWRKQAPKTADVIDLLGINPLDHYSNFSFIADFTSNFGHIKHSNLTGLRPRNQRKVAKAVRRAIGLGIHPSIHHHLELLQMEWPKK